MSKVMEQLNKLRSAGIPVRVLDESSLPEKIDVEDSKGVVLQVFTTYRYHEGTLRKEEVTRKFKRSGEYTDTTEFTVFEKLDA